MPRRRDPLLEPRQYMQGDWPAGVIAPGAPLAVHYMRDIVLKVRAAMDNVGISPIDLCRMTNLDRSTLRLLLNGYVWPDMVTLTKIEQALDVTVWPQWGDATFRDQQTKIIALEDQIRALRSAARKKAAAARTASTR